MSGSFNLPEIQAISVVPSPGSLHSSSSCVSLPSIRFDSNASASDSSEDGDDSEDESAKKKKTKKAKVVKEKKERKPRKEVRTGRVQVLIELMPMM